MGIKGLTGLIKKTSPDSIQHIGLYTMKEKRVAIDTSIFLYKSLINVRSKGDYLRNKDGKVVSHIQDNPVVIRSTTQITVVIYIQ